MPDEHSPTDFYSVLAQGLSYVLVGSGIYFVAEKLFDELPETIQNEPLFHHANDANDASGKEQFAVAAVALCVIAGILLQKCFPSNGIERFYDNLGKTVHKKLHPALYQKQTPQE